MATFNTSAILKAAHAKADGHCRVARAYRSGIAFGKTYRQVFAICLSEAWTSAKVAAQPAQLFIVRLDYNDMKNRGLVKSLGGRWNADAKTWSVTCKPSQLGTLAAKVVTKVTARPAVDAQVGFAHGDTRKEWSNIRKYGYDAIEY